MFKHSNVLSTLCIGVSLATGVFAGSAALAQIPSNQTPSKYPELTTEDQKVLYAFGAALANNLREFALSPEEKKIVQAAFDEVSNGGKSKLDVAEYLPKVRALYTERQQKIVTEEKAAGAAYLEKAAKEPGAVQVKGMVVRTLKKGTGPKPKQTDTVKLNYTNMLIDGTVFDASKDHDGGKPVELAMGVLVPCWSQAISEMQVGGKSRLVCPSDLTYGDSGAPKVRPGATTVVEVELVEIVKAPPAESTQPESPSSKKPSAKKPNG